MNSSPCLDLYAIGMTISHGIWVWLHRLVLSLSDPLTTVAPCHVLYMTLTSSLDCRRLGPVVKYLSDVMLPDGLFGPVIGFVIRLKFFS